MAFVIIYSIKDEKGKLSSTEINLPASTAFADVILFAGAMAQAIEPLISGSIERVGIAYIVALSTITGLKATPAANSDVEEGARFGFKTVNNFVTALRLPTFREDFVQVGTREVDTVDPAVAAFVTAMRTGINLTPLGGTGVVAPVDKRNEDITTLDSAKEQFVSSR